MPAEAGGTSGSLSHTTDPKSPNSPKEAACKPTLHLPFMVKTKKPRLCDSLLAFCMAHHETPAWNS